jgi:hypothetical protein
MMGKTTDEDANGDDPIADDHHRGIDRVARQRGVGVGCRKHHREDERRLDHGHAHGESQRAQGLAQPMRHDLGVVDRRHHRADETGSAEYGDERAHPRCDRDNEQGEGQPWQEPDPRGHAS